MGRRNGQKRKNERETAEIMMENKYRENYGAG